MKHSSDDAANTTVIDITYLCNASCDYCQWGNKSTTGRVHLTLQDVLLPKDTLDALGTKRVVLSGGEPRLSPDLEEILRYYSQFVDEVIIISNGYGLDRAEVSRLIRAGATGFTVSLDSVSSQEAILTRQTRPTLHANILKNLREIASDSRNFELGLNSVVSHVTGNWCTVRSFLEFGKALELDFVKFQPVFNDGYVEKNAPELVLGTSDLANLVDIAS